MSLFEMSTEFRALNRRIVVGHLGNPWSHTIAGISSQIERWSHEYTCSGPWRLASAVARVTLCNFCNFCQ